jgi:alanine racemase
MSRQEKNLNGSLVWARVDLGRLRRNFAAIRAELRGREVEVLAVVKADAYGHGMVPVAKTLYAQGARSFGVANIHEAAELRKALPASRILVLGGFHAAAQASLFIRKNITPTLFSLEDAAILDRRLKKPFAVHVKIDTGMGRLGVWHEDARSFFRELKRFKNIHVEGIYTHFSSADGASPAFTLRQYAHFEKALGVARREGFAPKYLHAANSLGLLRFKRCHLNLVRPGIILYGINPAKTGKLPKGIRPILELKTRISFLKSVDEGRTLSYGATYATREKTKIATLPVGYSHGYRVGFSNKARVLVRGRECPVVGRVTMDQTLVDVGRVPEVRRWDEVTLIGQEGKNQVQARDLAGLTGTIPYEIVCNIHSRIPRIYRG